MVLSHGNHGNFSKKLTCFLNPTQKEKAECQDYSKKIIMLQKENMLSFLSLTQIFLTKGGMHIYRFWGTIQVDSCIVPLSIWA